MVVVKASTTTTNNQRRLSRRSWASRCEPSSRRNVSHLLLVLRVRFAWLLLFTVQPLSQQLLLTIILSLRLAFTRPVGRLPLFWIAVEMSLMESSRREQVDSPKFSEASMASRYATPRFDSSRKAIECWDRRARISTTSASTWPLFNLELSSFQSAQH